MVLWVGGMHASHETIGKSKSVVDILDEQHKVNSIYASLNGAEFPNLVTPDLKAPVMVATKDAATLSKSKLTDELRPQTVGGYDYVILVPRNKRF